MAAIIKGSRARWAVVLNAYVDETKPEGARIVALGGYVFHESASSRYERRWKDVLGKADPPLERFHMTDWESGWGEFKGWPKEYREFFYKKLVNIIHQTAKLAINVGVDLEAFDALSPEDQVLLGKYPYTLAAGGW